jgi:hypothetical protein
MDKIAGEKLRKRNNHPSADSESGVSHDQVVGESHKRTRKTALSENSMKRASLQWSWELESRFLHYLADITQEAHRDIDRSEVVAEALEEFLTKRDH